MPGQEKKKVSVYCSKCGSFINEVFLYGVLPEALKNHIICRVCYNEDKEVV